jgi:hypothetical protein
LSLGGTSPYTSTDKTSKNKYVHKRNNIKTQYKQYKTENTGNKWRWYCCQPHGPDALTPQKIFLVLVSVGDRGGTVVKVLCYKSEGRCFDSRWCHWNFLLTQCFWLHYGPQPLTEMSSRKSISCG